MSNYELSLEKNIISELEVNRANVVLGIGNTEAVWGTIQGDISNQLDLIEKLDSMAESIPDISPLATKEEVDTKANKTDVYTKEEIENKNYLTVETDPTVPDWAKQPNKPAYTASEVGALPDTTEIPDISPLATKEELTSGLLDKADKIDVYTKSEIDSKGFLTEHQSLEDYALKTDIPDISNLATKDEVALKANRIDVYDKTEIAEKFLEAGNLYDTKYYDKNTTDSLLAVKANIDDVPTKISDLTNDSGYINDVSDLATKKEISDMLTRTEASLTYQVKGEYLVSADIADLASKAELPTKTSQLLNDSGYINTIPEEYITETELEAKGYLTEHQDISNLATKAELATKADASLLDGKVDKVEGKSLIDDTEITRLATVTNYDDTEVKNQIATKANSIDVYTKLESDSKYLTEHQSLADYALKSEIPTLNSQLINDAGYLTSIPEEYVTETELLDKGYLTEHQDISYLATKDELLSKADISSLDTKVDKVIGKSLIDDTEIERLSSVTNYDDTTIKYEITLKANSADVYTKTESDAKYLTEHQSLDSYALKTEIPDITGLATKEELSLKANSSDIPTKTSQLVNDSGYLTEHQSLEDYALKSEIPDISGLATKLELADKVDTAIYNADKATLATKTEIPTATSQLTNDSGFITVIPEEYVTETELASSMSVKADSATVYDKEYIDQMMIEVHEHIDEWDWAEYD